MTEQTWALTDHVCRNCGGRILRCVTGQGMTAGGNPLWKCADCGITKVSMEADVICWCGMQQKFQSFPAYCCRPLNILKKHPELAPAFQACGIRTDCPDREIGIVLRSDLERLYQSGKLEK